MKLSLAALAASLALLAAAIVADAASPDKVEVFETITIDPDYGDTMLTLYRFERDGDKHTLTTGIELSASDEPAHYDTVALVPRKHWSILKKKGEFILSQSANDDVIYGVNYERGFVRKFSECWSERDKCRLKWTKRDESRG